MNEPTYPASGLAGEPPLFVLAWVSRSRVDLDGLSLEP